MFVNQVISEYGRMAEISEIWRTYVDFCCDLQACCQPTFAALKDGCLNYRITELPK
jgi:hypothetical protein